MFLENEADMVLSYTTSPAYHLMYEDTSKYKAANFLEGHYIQIEIAHSRNCDWQKPRNERNDPLRLNSTSSDATSDWLPSTKR